MADVFVWDAATGAADGSTWEDAYDSLMQDWGAEAGFTPATDTVWVRSIHTETSSSTVTITGSSAEGATARVNVISVVGAASGTDPGNLAAGAAVNTDNTAADIGIEEGIYIYGVDFFSNDDIRCGITSTDQDMTLETCRLELIGTDTGDRISLATAQSRSQKYHFINVILDFAAVSQALLFGNTCIFVWERGSVAFDVNNLVEPASAVVALAEFRGIDFSAMTSSNLIFGAFNVNSSGLYKFSRCLLPTGGSIIGGGTVDVPGMRIESYHCQIGTDADPAYQMEINDSRGKIVTDVARYRTGGASDRERATPISWDFDTTVGSVRGYPGHALEGPPITAWTDGDASTAHTYRIYFASDATINDDELWFDLEGPNDAATNSLAVINTTRVAPRTTATAHTTDSNSAWTGSGVGTKQQMDIVYTPDKPGPVTARIMMAKGSDNIYVDPKIYIDP